MCKKFYLLDKLNLPNTDDVASPNRGIPMQTIYASEEGLDAIFEQYRSENALNWKMARFLAFDELYNLEEEKSWKDATISKTAILIYDNKQKPKFYEFRVLRNNLEIGTITANIFPDGGAIAYILDEARDYSGANKARSFGDSKVIDNNYPNIGFASSVSRSGDVLTVSSIDGKIQSVPNYYNTVQDFLDDGGSVEELAKLFQVEESDIISVKEERKKVEAQLENDFRLMNEALPNVENLTDEEIENMLDTSYLRGIKRLRSNIIPAYSRIATKDYEYSDFNCGSSALAWIYAGINPYYNGKNILLNNNMRDFTKTLERLLETSSSGVTLPCKFSGALRNITGNSYRMDLLKFFFGNTDKHMKTSQLPVLSLRGSGIRAWEWKWAWHYRVIYGAIWINEEHRFLWWKWSTDHSFKYYMHDNGTDGPNGAFIENAWNSGFYHLKVVRN